ncbi:hypothetical protein HK101_007470 [Irineochytrium annulatum]|nr:hypothetical protein HK101_007470 [Irineochytrium annulatum]
MEKVMITPIYHGEVPAMAQLNRFYAAVVNSSYIDTLSQYGPITRGTFSQPYIESPAHALPTTKIIDDAVDVQPYIQSLVDRNLIKYTVPNAYHPIHLSPAYTAVTYRGLRSCVGFCGYHSSMTVKHHGKKYRVMYAVFPDPYIPGCACGGGAADDGAVEDLDNLFMMASHELAESITDPANDAVAWSNDGDEVADYCQWQKGSVVGGDGNVWTVQKVWGDRENKCID